MAQDKVARVVVSLYNEADKLMASVECVNVEDAIETLEGVQAVEEEG